MNFKRYGEQTTLELHELKLQSNAPARAVVERTEICGVNVVLKIARVPVVREIEQFYAEASGKLTAPKLRGNESPIGHSRRQSLRNLKIERKELRITPGAIARSHKVLILVDQRKREASVPVHHRRNRDLFRQTDVAPEKQPVRRVERLQRTLVCANDRISQVAKIIVEGIQIAGCTRVYIGEIQMSSLLQSKTTGHLKLAITRLAVIS